MGIKTKNQANFYMLCILLGATTGVLVWMFLKAFHVGVQYLWEWGPEQLETPFYTLIVCTVGGLLIGLFRRRIGDFPEDMNTVLAKVKKEGHYEYKNMLMMAIAALLPLLLGASIGPEAGMTGIIIGLCYWVGDNVKYAKKHTEELTELGTAVTLGVIFHSPLFGIFEVNESIDDQQIALPKSAKVVSYGVCIAAGMGAFILLSNLFGGSAGLPSLEIDGELVLFDYAMIIPYIILGGLLGLFYQTTHKITQDIANRIPVGLSEMVGGICLGITGTFLPLVMFSGEESIAELGELYGIYAPIAWIGIAIVKILITNICISSGLKGGHFFPLIFAGVAAGFGLAGMMSGDFDHMVVAAAITTASMLGVSMKKPLAVAMLLLLIFPVKLLVWCFVAAAIGSKIGNRKKNEQ